MEEQDNETYRDDILEVYIAYDRLRTEVLATILQNFSAVADVLAADYLGRFNDRKLGQMPTLDIDSMHTGESIRFTLKEGWLPGIRSSAVAENENADIIVELPKALGIPFVIGYLVLQVLNSYQDTQIKQLDIIQKELDIRLKQTQLGAAISNNNQPVAQTVNYYINNQVPEVKPLLLDTLKAFLHNQEIKRVNINGTEIKFRNTD